MKLNILEGRNDRKEHSFRMKFRPDAEYLAGKRANEAEISGTYRVSGNDVHLQYELLYRLYGTCDRCGDEAVFDGHVQGEEIVRKGSDVRPDERKNVDEDDGVYRYDGDEINLGRIANEAIFLNLPTVFLCRPDCKGLCPRCGRNRNEGECGCEDDHSDSPFAKLLQYKNQTNTDGGK